MRTASRWGRPWLGPSIAALFATLAGSWTIEVRADSLELPTPSLRPLDRLRKENPEAAAARAAEQLAAPAVAADALSRAELYLVIAYARGQEGWVPQARSALERAQAEILRLGPGADRHILELRLAMGGFGIAKTPAQYEARMSDIDRLLRQATRGTREWAALLAVRGDLEAELDHPDLAVADQLTAYDTDRASGWTEEATDVALSLATTYRRAGLWSDAEAMISEVIAYAAAENFTWLLGLAYFTQGQIYVNQHDWQHAFAALSKSQSLMTQVGDRLTAALATLPMCDALIGAGRIAEAKPLCKAKFATFVEMGREDLATDSMIYQARIDLLDGQYSAAAKLLDAVLTEHLDQVPLRYKSRLYRERAEALAALGRHREASANLEQALAAADSVALSDRQRTTAVLTGVAKARALASENRTLALENRAQRQQLASDQKVRNLAAALAAAGLSASALLGYLLYVSGRHRRALDRHAAILGTLTDNLSETVMLLDGGRRIQFSNRAPFQSDGPVAGRRIEDVVPQELREPIRRAIAQVIAERKPQRFETSSVLREGADRRFLEHTAIPVLAGDEIVAVTLSSSDVTERRAIEDTLRLQARILDTMNEGVVVIDQGTTVTFANAAMHELLGYPPGSLTGASAVSLTADAAEPQPWERSFADLAPCTHELRLRRRDGAEVLVALANSRLGLGARVADICVCRDISDQRRIERAVAGASGREALHVGGSLHEGLAQELTGATLMLRGLTARLRGLDEAAEQSAEYLSQFLNGAIHTARELASRLSPVSTVRGSFGAALQALVEETAGQLTFSVGYPEELAEFEMDALSADELYRLARDVLSCAIGRGDCAALSIDFTATDDLATLTIRWGLAAAAVTPAVSRFDLEVFGHRARLIGGSCERLRCAPPFEGVVLCVPRRSSVLALHPDAADLRSRAAS